MKSTRSQSGAALLTAMIIVTLVASLAAAMVWQQVRAVQIEAAERARAQSGWILQGALDWARRILLEDLNADRSPRNGGAPADHLGEVWAVPLAEARLSTFLAADRPEAQADDGPEAFLSGSILDLQSRYNLRALLVGDSVAPLEKRTLERIFQSAGVGPALAETLISQLRATYGTSTPPGDAASKGGSTPPSNDAIQPVNLDQLIWLGLPADVVEKLRPFVVLLPVPTTVNLNTAPKEVIAALFDGMDLASAECLVQSRKTRPLRKLPDDAKACLHGEVSASAERAGATSSFFEVTGRLRLEERQLVQRSVIQRNGLDMQVLSRERVAQILDPGSTR